MKNKEIEELLNYLKDENEYYTEEEEVLINCGELILEKKDVDLLLSYIEQLEIDYKEANESVTKKAELGEHYKHLYSEVKKQKDDVIEYIKYQLSNLDFEKDIKARMLGSMIIVMLKGVDNENN